ncbi:MAG: ribosome-associated translation inhibitor RaiA [Defluviitaleaceae bacterium]|nr:ribosome-associated translation inhibitor RaiA [Defluviitaleaceae bacterium]
MRFTFTGKNVVVTQDMKERAEKKIGRLAKLFPDEAMVQVTFSVVKQENKIEVSVPLNKRLLRGEVVSSDMFAAIDGVVDVLDRQIVKYKQRVKDRSRRDTNFKGELEAFNAYAGDYGDDDADDGAIVIERTKHFPAKPMDPEEAIMEMEMLGHTFFVFRNSGNLEINVVYKRRGGSYGIIDPNDPIDCE